MDSVLIMQFEDTLFHLSWVSSLPPDLVYSYCFCYVVIRDLYNLVFQNILMKPVRFEASIVSNCNESLPGRSAF
jgi:hypothetical protein